MTVDLADHFKRDAEHLPGNTQHPRFEFDRSNGFRKMRTMKRWQKRNEIGEGSLGTVWLVVEDNGSERVVKAISKRLYFYNKIDDRKARPLWLFCPR